MGLLFGLLPAIIFSIMNVELQMIKLGVRR
jgi:hypothetical protein